MVEIIITSSVLILMLIFVRKLCWGKISRRLQYGLWLLVVIRLLVPASFLTSSLSVMNVVEHVEDAAHARWQTVHNESLHNNSVLNNEHLQAEDENVNISKPFDKVIDENGVESDVTEPNIMDVPLNATQKMDWGDILPKVLFGIYIVGVLFTGGCIILCNLKFHRLLAADKQLIGREGRINVYLTSRIHSPCLCGILKPSIYMTEKSLCTQERKNHIMLHELTHYKHLDHIWAVVRSLCLVLYWFHPLVWMAARLSVEDSELACDEGTFIRLGEGSRVAYGHTLVEMMTEQEKSNRILYCATGMINGKAEIKKRITAIAFYKKQVIWMAVLVVAFAMLLSSCTAGTVGQGNEEYKENVGSEDNAVMGETMAENSHSEDATDTRESKWQLASDVVMNKDGTFRMAEYEVDLTGDKVKDRIVFDVLFYADLGAEHKTVTKSILWDNLWHGSEVVVKILEGSEHSSENGGLEEVILEEYSFSEAHAGNGNLAVVRYEGQNCILLYSNLMFQGSGGFGYQIWQIPSSGQQPVLLEEMDAVYTAPGNGDNSQETIEQVIRVGEKLDSFLAGSNTEILLNASGESEQCYLHGSESGLLNGVRRQNALGVFMTEAGGNGTELKIADYFYPTGMEPITKLPEDAEARILNGEIIYMEVSPDNSTAGRLDLNGDGEKEVLYLEAIGSYFNDQGWNNWGGMDSNFRVRVNNLYYESHCSFADPVLMAFSPDGKQILLAVYDDGPSGDPVTYFFRYDEVGVHPAGKIFDDLRNAVMEADGVIRCTFRADMLQTEWAWGYYYWNGSEIVRREDDIFYFVDDSKWREENQIPLVLLKEITVFAERSENSQAITMKPQKVRNVASDQSEWILLEGEDGTKGWIRIVQFCFPSEESDPFELFEGLYMAG